MKADETWKRKPLRQILETRVDAQTTTKHKSREYAIQIDETCVRNKIKKQKRLTITTNQTNLETRKTKWGTQQSTLQTHREQQ